VLFRSPNFAIIRMPARSKDAIAVHTTVSAEVILSNWIVPKLYNMLSVSRISTYSLHLSYVSFYIAAALFNGFLLLYFLLWFTASYLQLVLCLAYTFVALSY